MFASKAPYIRQVLMLACVAGALTLLAILAATLTREPAHRVFKPEPYFPSLAQHASELRRIHIQNKDHTTELTYAPETGWVISDKDHYRARYEKIQEFVRSLADMERFEKRTSDPKWHEKLLLTDPREKDGKATLIQLLGTANEPLAELLVGANADVDAASGKEQVYVRGPGDNQAWLARAANLTPVSTDSSDWLDTSIIDVPKDRIARADVAPSGAPTYVIVHASSDTENFTIENMPKGMKLKADTSANGVGTVLSDLTLRDVAGADRIIFSPSSTAVTYQTFNGLKLRVETSKLGEDTWVRIIPSTTEKADEQAKAEAADLARRLSPWVFEIESWKGTLLDTKLDSLIEPGRASAQKPPSPHSGNAAPHSAATDKPNSTMAPPAPKHANTQKSGALPADAKALGGTPSSAKPPASSHEDDKKPPPHSDNASPPGP